MSLFMSDINQPSLPTLFYSVLVSISVFMALLTVFHSINSPNNSSFSRSVLPVLSLPYRSFQLYVSLWKSVSALIWSLVVEWAQNTIKLVCGDWTLRLHTTVPADCALAVPIRNKSFAGWHYILPVTVMAVSLHDSTMVVDATVVPQHLRIRWQLSNIYVGRATKLPGDFALLHHRFCLHLNQCCVINAFAVINKSASFLADLLALLLLIICLLHFFKNVWSDWFDVCMFCFIFVSRLNFVWILKNFAVSLFLCWISRRGIVVCFWPWYYPLWSSGLKSPTNELNFLAEQKWSKGKVRDKLNNLILFDKATYDKMLKEVPNYKLITPSVVSERLKVRGSLAKQALRELHSKGQLCVLVCLSVLVCMQAYFVYECV